MSGWPGVVGIAKCTFMYLSFSPFYPAVTFATPESSGMLLSFSSIVPSFSVAYSYVKVELSVIECWYCIDSV